MSGRRSYGGPLLLLLALSACGEPPEDESRAPPSTGLRFLGSEAGDGFARATNVRELTFPADHGSHPEYRTEWWYFTGNLATAAGRHFGFELTFFRYALGPPAVDREGASAFRTQQVWMAHLAVTDTDARRFVARERLAREALGLAGSAIEPLRIWVKDWSAAGEQQGNALSFKLDANDGDVGVSLTLTPTVPPVPQGDRGLDRKGAAPGNASYYYSMPRLAADGVVFVDGESWPVTGLAWMDREWGTSSLEPGVVGWDWFALHLSDGASLMFYRLSLATGGSSPFSGGSLVGAQGQRTRLAANDVSLTALEHWRSPASGARYPVAWRLVAPRVGISLDINPYLEDQEVNLSVRYWEGAVHGEGTGPLGALTAQGYLELAGY